MANKALYVVVAVVGMGVASGAAWWFQKGGAKAPAAATAGPGAAPAAAPGRGGTPGVEVVRVKTLKLQDDAQAVGTLRSRQSVTLKPETAGRVARIERLRSADGVPMALEYSSWPADILPDPQSVQGSLYDHVRALGHVPTHAVQRVSAANLKVSEAQLLNMQAGQAVLRIDRTGYLASGRPVEFTRGLYRSDIYDFIAELRLEASPVT